MSRYTGLWVGFKCVNETVEQTATIEIDAERPVAVYPAADDNDQPDVHFVPGRFNPQAEEQLVERVRLPLVHKFVKENRLNRKILGEPGATLGIISAGKSYQDLMQALQILGLDQKSAEELGISVFKVGCIWPLEPEGLKAFAHSLRQIFVVEEKKPFLEDQVKTILCNESQKPLVFGKSDEQGTPIFCSDKQLEPVEIAVAIVDRLKAMSMADAGMLARRSELLESVTEAEHRSLPDLQRSPSFCSGCPHNTSTKLPENSIAGSGIGCHGMALFSRDDMLNFTHMGAEGAQWTGVGHYVDTPHIFQNLGDGTYFHSGLLALRSAVASGVNITYKILFNDAVAMTGGQPVDGQISVGAITHQVLSEGVKRCVVISDAPESYGAGSNLASGVDVFHRDQMDKVQKQLREVAGCTVIIYEQTCATEKRRRRKRGLMETPDHRLFINDAVCEGCGDCSVASGCVSLQPLETPLGRKRIIDQSSCNMDFSCEKWFCP
ncbi:MAG: thiamine pyrophosphate-dependent enzyme, partial [Pseudomonadota bacterium]|nr:thiamine pyrophosphate-dependent enzyme [Pseudomonadota bacterium]